MLAPDVNSLINAYRGYLVQRQVFVLKQTSTISYAFPSSPAVTLYLLLKTCKQSVSSICGIAMQVRVSISMLLVAL